MLQPESYWSYKAPPTPELSDLPAGSFAGSEAGWNSLTPGMRREIYRSAMKRESAASSVAVDAARMARADALQHQGEVQISGRETL